MYKKNFCILDNIIVYGTTLHAFCCIATIQSLNLPNFIISFVEPYQDEDERPSLDVFNNPKLHDALYAILEMHNVEVYQGYYFSSWQLYRDNFISAAKFQSRRGFITLPCDFFFCYSNKEVVYTTFSGMALFLLFCFILKFQSRIIFKLLP